VVWAEWVRSAERSDGFGFGGCSVGDQDCYSDDTVDCDYDLPVDRDSTADSTDTAPRSRAATRSPNRDRTSTATAPHLDLPSLGWQGESKALASPRSPRHRRFAPVSSETSGLARLTRTLSAPPTPPSLARLTRGKLSVTFVTGAERRLLAGPPVPLCRRRIAPTAGEAGGLALFASSRRRRIVCESARHTRHPIRRRQPGSRIGSDLLATDTEQDPSDSEWSARRSVASSRGGAGTTATTGFQTHRRHVG
jgi:hypothetical protein